MKKMTFILGRDGTSTVEVDGAIDDECLELTKAFEDAMGTLESRTFKEEFGDTSRVTDAVHDRNNA